MTTSLTPPPRPPLVRPLFIAEVKQQSPFGFHQTRYTWDQLLTRAQQIADMISIHTDPRWGGGFSYVSAARLATHPRLPILAKGIHPTDDDLRRAFDAGADYALCVGRIPADDLVDRCLIEMGSEHLLYLPRAVKAVHNARDLATGGANLITFAYARSLHPGWLCQASMIRSWADVHPGANAILVGEHLMDFPLP